MFLIVAFWNMQEESSKALRKIATDYFTALARMFPVMCSSDEFDAFPRAQAAQHHDHILDSFSVESLSNCLSHVKSCQYALQVLSVADHERECQIDKELLSASMAGVLIELETKKTWRHNPLLYLKVAMIGLDHALNKPVATTERLYERLFFRLKAIPRLFKEAITNLESVPDVILTTVYSMTADCKSYLNETKTSICANLPVGWSHQLEKGWQEAQTSLEAFERFCLSLKPVAEPDVSRTSLLNETLHHRFLYKRSLDEIWEMAQEEWYRNLDCLKTMAEDGSLGIPWQKLYASYTPPDMDVQDLLNGYQKECDRLRSFFHSHGFAPFARPMPLTLKPTPTYLRSVRGSASFCSALTGTDGEKDIFYITTQYGQNMGQHTAVQVAARLHREYRFLSAHETIPGHHLLDTVRRGLKNPIRRQIESPLFYEGWATNPNPFS